MILRHKVTLQENIGGDDGQGGLSEDETWVDIVSSMYADVVPLSGGRRFFSAANQQVITHRVKVRTREGIAQDQRFVWYGKNLIINSIYPASGNFEFLMCDCTEII
jgi:SPP1 family predicted phage head-tail adaptor